MFNPEDGRRLIAEAIATFPETFKLRAYPGFTFRISPSSSYVNDSGKVQLYTQILVGDDSAGGVAKWLDFAKGTIAELRAEVRVD